ncbi:hypothetical protein MNBD_NITROSPINAE02-303 [hydrothermal vent metagenome]|uniref:Flagellar assembly protein T C-terminal domain-containing protein n=1 Tax=hydrothermal vent metagenome TaxID=652676 RepID=A0A3B1CC00_9ZZZZ
MKMKTAFFIVFLFALPAGFAGAHSFSLAAHFAKAVTAGGFTDGDEKDQGAQEKSGGPTLEDLRNLAPATNENVDGADRAAVGKEIMEGYQSGEMTDDYFADGDRQNTLAYQRMFETAGFVASTFEGHGQIVDAVNSSQMFFGPLEGVYIDKGKKSGLRLGDRFWVMHAEDTQVNHPETGDRIGVKVLVDGIIEIVEIVDNTSKARIFRSFNSIKRGYKIMPYDGRKAPYADPDKRIAPKDIDGYLISGRHESKAYGQGDIVYLNVGESAGVEPGDVFEIIDSEMVRLADGSFEPGLPKIKGKAKVIATRDISSAALIVISENVMKIGDKVRFAPERLP